MAGSHQDQGGHRNKGCSPRVPKTASGPLAPGLRSLGLQGSVPPQPCPGHLPTWGLARAAHPTTNPHTFSPSLTRCWPVCSPSYKMELESTAPAHLSGLQRTQGRDGRLPEIIFIRLFCTRIKSDDVAGKIIPDQGLTPAPTIPRLHPPGRSQ